MRLPFSVLGVALPGEKRNSASRGVCGSLPRPKIRPPRSLRDCARASADSHGVSDYVNRDKATHTQPRESATMHRNCMVGIHP